MRYKQKISQIPTLNPKADQKPSNPQETPAQPLFSKELTFFANSAEKGRSYNDFRKADSNVNITKSYLGQEGW